MDRSVGRNSDRSGSERIGVEWIGVWVSLVSGSELGSSGSELGSSGSELGSSCFVSGVEWIGASLVTGSELGSSGCVEA